MIYEMILKCVDDLGSRWSDMGNAAETLATALGSDPDPGLQATQPSITGLAQQITNRAFTPSAGTGASTMIALGAFPSSSQMTVVQTIAAQRMNISTPTPGGYPRLMNVISTAQNNIFLPSSNAVQIVSSVVSAWMPQWLGSASSDTVSAARLFQSRLSDLDRLNAECLQEIVEMQSNEASRAHLGGLRSSVNEISTYPVLTQDISYGPPSSGGGNGSLGTGSTV